MKALILAAGLGTRLKPLTDNIPKPLLSIGDKPLLEYHLDALRKHDITTVLINSHYLADQVKVFAKDYGLRYPKMRITVTYEPQLLGSAGTLKHNENFFKDTKGIVVIYGDNLTDINYHKIIERHAESPRIATIASYFEKYPETKGIIEYDENLHIKKFIEKPAPEQITNHNANAGIYVLAPEIFSFLQQHAASPLDFGYHVFPDLLKQGQLMHIYPMKECLLDIGTPEGYNKAQEIVKNLEL